MKTTLETVVVAAAGLMAWLAIQGWLIPPMARGTPKVSVSRHSSLCFSLRTMLIATTLVAVVLGVVCYTVR
jgi:hypothetical protein